MQLLDYLAKIKNKKNLILAPFSMKILNLGIKSNTFTVFSFLFGILAFIFLLNNNFLYAAFLLISIIFDILDGGVAKLENKKSKAKFKGILYDDLSDRIVTFLIISKICLFLAFCEIPWIILLYPLIKGSHIYLKQKYKENFQILYFDRIPLILIIFKLYYISLIFIFISILINIFELIIKIRKRNNS